MKSSLFYSLLMTAGLVLGNLVASAAESPNQAIVLKLTGNVQVILPDGSQPVISVGYKLPQGAQIITGAGAEIYIQPFPGAVATIKERTSVSLEKLSEDTRNGAVTKQTALLNLKSGIVVSTIDPSRKSINDYSVRTPKGVAAARGTSFTAVVEADNGVTISANADSVQFTMPGSNGAPAVNYTISQGMVIVTPVGGTPSAPVPLASIAKSNPTVAAAVRAGVAAMADVLQNNLGGLNSASATDLAIKVVSVAATALPTEAATMTTQVVNAMTTSGTQATNNNQDAVAKVTAAATLAAPEQAAAIVNSVSATMNSNGMTVTTQQLQQQVEAVTPQVKETTNPITTFPPQDNTNPKPSQT